MRFRELIEASRTSFDSVEKVPVEAMWIGIDHQLRKRTRTRRIIWSAAAAILLLCIATPFMLNRADNGFDEHPLVEDQLLQYEQHYARLTADKETSLETDVLNPDTYQEILSELEQLDEMYAELKAEINNVPNAEQLIETAIRFHERRLRILELLEKEIENHKRNQHDDEEIKI